MLFAIHCLDDRDALPSRLANHAAHRSYLASAKVHLVVAGPLLAEDGTMIGSLFIVEASSRSEVQEFNQNDPFSATKVWEKVEIHGFEMRTDDWRT